MIKNSKRERRKKRRRKKKKKLIFQGFLGVTELPLKGVVKVKVGDKVKDWESRFSSSEEHAGLRLRVESLLPVLIPFPSANSTNPGSRCTVTNPFRHIFGEFRERERERESMSIRKLQQTIINNVICLWSLSDVYY